MKYITKAKLEGLSFEINLTSIINTGITKFFGVGGGGGLVSIWKMEEHKPGNVQTSTT